MSRLIWNLFPDKTTLVPLTNSLYVPGKLCDAERFIVDVGTGYYVKKVRIVRALTPRPSRGRCCLTSFRLQTRAQALKHYEAKVDYIRTNLEALQETISKKQDNMNYLVSIMQAKLQEQAAPRASKT